MRAVYRRYRQILHYLIAGVLTTLVNLGVYYICVLTFLDPQNLVQLQAANVISWIAAVTFAYFANRRFVFESKNPHVVREAGAFFAARLATLLMEMAVMYLMVTVGGISDKPSKLVAQVLVIVTNYVLSRLVVFRKKEKQAVIHKKTG